MKLLIFLYIILNVFEMIPKFQEYREIFSERLILSIKV